MEYRKKSLHVKTVMAAYMLKNVREQINTGQFARIKN